MLIIGHLFDIDKQKAKNLSHQINPLLTENIVNMTFRPFLCAQTHDSF